MNRRIKNSLFILAVFILTTQVKAQTTVSQQINTIPANITQYMDGYLHDLSTFQGTAYLNSFNTTGRVLGAWELNLSVKAGTAYTSSPYAINTNFGSNFELQGLAPSLLGDETNGSLFFQINDETTGAPIIDPSTGKKIGFSIPLLSGTGLNHGISPALMPVLTLGIGFGTEVSVSVLPEAIKLASKTFSGDFEINKDMMYSVGVRHNLFHWIPALNKKNVHLTLGATYNKMTLEATAGKGLFDDFTNTNSTFVSAANNLTGAEYGFTSLGFEAMLSKKLGFIDLSLFASTNKSDYYIRSKGDIEIKVASDFTSINPQSYNTVTLNNLVDINATTNRFIYGVTAQFNLGRLNLGLKCGISDEIYVATAIGFKIIKNK